MRLLIAAEKTRDRKRYPFFAMQVAGADSGFDGSEVVKAFNELEPRFRNRFSAQLITDVIPSYDGSFSELRKFVAEGAKAMIDVQAERHWVLAEAVTSDGTIKCFDPSAHKQIEERSRACSSDGVLFLPVGTR